MFADKVNPPRFVFWHSQITAILMAVFHDGLFGVICGHKDLADKGRRDCCYGHTADVDGTEEKLVR